MQARRTMAQMTWPEIEAAFAENCLIVIPLGAECKEHGFHLPMNTDLLIAQIFSDYILQKYSNVLLAPSITDSYFPVFVEYPGSSTLTLETATDLILQRCQIWYQQGAKRFYIVNTGISSLLPLARAKATFEKTLPNLHFAYLDLSLIHEDERLKSITQQKVGTHADELETSLMLYLFPQLVHLDKAVPEEAPKKPGPLTRDITAAADKTISASGAWGNPCFATKAKGELVLKLMQEWIDKDLKQFTLT